MKAFRITIDDFRRPDGGDKPSRTRGIAGEASGNNQKKGIAE
jgi:hypothetical protein